MEELKIEGFNGRIKKDEPMSKHTTYHIGGPAKYFVYVNDAQNLHDTVVYGKENKIPWIIVGDGSNYLVSDEGFDGAIVKLAGDFNKFSFDMNRKICTVGAGVRTAKIYNEFQKNYYKGLGYCVGIPGTIGGAVKMNAGRKRQWISSSLTSVQIMTSDGEVQNLKATDLEWGYRFSPIKDDEIVLQVNMKFKPTKSENEREYMRNRARLMTLERRSHQPVGALCCGSVFKNPPDNFAGKLIEDAGFKNAKVGGAQVSDVHSNFIVNTGNAKASDVVELIRQIQQKVYDNTKIKLIPEVQFLGFKEEVSLF